MKSKIIINSLFGLITLILLIIVILPVYIEPWIGKKIETILNQKSKDYAVRIADVKVRVFKSSVEFKNITILSGDTTNSAQLFIKGEIKSIQFEGISLIKFLFKKNIVISKVTISACNISANIPFPNKPLPSILSPYNIQIGNIFFDEIDFAIKNTMNSKSYLVKEGDLNLYNLLVERQDTLSLSIVKQFEFKANECISVSSDSIYTYKIISAKYSTSSKTLVLDSLLIHPNFKDYNFTNKYKYQTNRYEAELSNIFASDFNAVDYFHAKSIACSYIEIGKMDLNIFRDKRKPFKHVKKAAFQDMIYNYPGSINIDSIGIVNGNIAFTIHAEKANQPGRISFNEIHARLINITNDTVYKTKNAFLELNADAMLMGKRKLTVMLKSKLFDNQNTFTVNGTLSNLEVSDLNPILEKTAFVYATSGKIDAMNFNFIANNTRANGKMTLIYHGLNIAVKNKKTDDTTAFAEKFISVIANSIILNSNPISGEKVRVGIIDYERDPEKFIFNYCFKSILSGIKSSLVKTQKKKN